MKAIIEKELCNPVDGQIVGPMYHVYGVSESGSKELIETIDGDIKEAARLAERTIDLSELEVAYKKDPAAFQSTVYPTSLDNVLSLESKHKNEADMLYKDIDMCIHDFSGKTGSGSGYIILRGLQAMRRAVSGSLR